MRSARSALPSLHVPEHAVDAQSLVALADLVVSAGGTMNREAAALGTPVYTTFAGRLGAVDETLIRDGRLRPLTDAGGTRAPQARATAARSDAIPGCCSTCCCRPEGRPRPGPALSRGVRALISRPSTTGATGECAVT